jgi:Sulfotransferase family
VVGVGRSGTTLLRLMLDAHPEVAIPGETHFVPRVIKRMERSPLSADEVADFVTEHKRWGDFHLDADELRERFRSLKPFTAGDAIRSFYGLYSEREGKTRYGDKTPGYMREMLRLQRVLPEARFIHIIRDGRDVALSVLKLNWGPSNPTEAAELWTERIEKARQQAPKVKHYLEVRFEDLVMDTEGTLRKVCEFIELDYDPVMLGYHERAAGRLKEKERDLPRSKRPDQPAELRMQSHMLAREPPREDRIGLWRDKMSGEDVAEYERVAAPLLTELGYELGARY